MTKLIKIKDPHSIITTFSSNLHFPESLEVSKSKYFDVIKNFYNLINSSSSTNDLLKKIRSKDIKGKDRINYLKLFRRCVSSVCDTEMTKKINTITNQTIIKNYGHTFKDIKELKKQFKNLDNKIIYSLSSLLFEYDNRGFQGYALTEEFFKWFKNTFKDYQIFGPTGAGKDIELKEIVKDFNKSFPCDFIIKRNNKILSVGFARYDSTRGGSQSDDRTEGNSNKVFKLKEYCENKKTKIKIIFLSDGPGLAAKDTWKSNCELEEMWSDNILVTTLKLCEKKITKNWLG